MYTSTLFNTFCILVALLQACTVIAMQKRNLQKEFPYFFRYTFFAVMSSAVLFPLLFGVSAHLFSYAQYFYAYWACSAMSSLLGFTVIHEVFANAFRPFPALRDLAGIMFRWAGLVLILVASILACASPETLGDRIVTGILCLERGVLVTQGGLLLFLLLFSSRLGMTWKHQGFGIALGFGFYASSQLIINSLRTQLGSNWDNMYSILQSVFYGAAVLVWTSYMVSPEPARITEEYHFAPKPILERWNQVLRGDGGIPEGTFLPSLEKIVDQVLSGERKRKVS